MQPSPAPNPRARHTALALLGILLAGCSAEESQPLDETLSLYASVAGIEGVYFYPPLGPDPTPSGTFEADLLDGLSVTIEAKASGGEFAALATFTERTDPAVKLLRTKERYWVNIPAAIYVTDPAKTYRVRVLLDGEELGASVLSAHVFEVMAWVPALPIGVHVRIEGTGAVRAIRPPAGSGKVPAHCTDGVRNKDETGVDCGGVHCPACPTCTDRIKNGAETGVDCGGPDCGACPIGQPCQTASDCASHECKSGACACSAEDDATFCHRLGFDCGTASGRDNCGDPRSAECGSCTAPAICGGRGLENLCDCPSEADAEFCQRLGKTCGVVTGVDNCAESRTTTCGACTGFETCGGAGVENVCGCRSEADADFCRARGASCGVVTDLDRCGRVRSVLCGVCTGAQTCGGAGIENTCGCTPESDFDYCLRAGKDCGQVAGVDDCGLARSVSCGACTAPATCGGGGLANVCGCTPESTEAFCQRQGAACGTASGADNCGAVRTADCGACAACPNPEGAGSTVHGAALTRYHAANACEGTCAAETRSCDNGVWKPSPFTYAATACSTSCSGCTTDQAHGGLTLAHGETKTGFTVSTVGCGDTCDTVASPMTCHNGLMDYGLTASSTCAVEVCLTCTVDAAHGGGTLAHGGTRVGYTASSVACGGSCTSLVGAMTCNDGVMDYGRTTTDRCSPVACLSCANPEGTGTTAHGASLTRYVASNACGGTCQAETRTCNNGAWSAPFTASRTSCDTTCSSCTVDAAHGGGVLAHGATRTGYTASAVACGASCSTVAGTMTCNNGVMDYAGTVSNTCAPAVCGSCVNPEGTGTTAHGVALTRYLSTNACGGSCSSETRTCNNGTWSPLPFTVSALTCDTTCSSCTVDATHGGGTLAHGATRAGYTATTVPCGGSCSTVAGTMTCNNGVMSYGGTVSTSCSVQTCASCTVDAAHGGGTLAHLATRAGYTAATVPCGGACSSVSGTMTCNNGVMSYGGTVTNSCAVQTCASCTVDAAHGGGTLAHNATRTGYTSTSVACGGSCTSVQGTMTCNNGTMSYGGTVSNTCAVSACAACANPEGTGTTAHNSSLTRYLASNACGGTCQSETRTCSNGTWSPSPFTYSATSCTTTCASCTVDAAHGGGTLAHNATRTGYSATSVPCGGACTSVQGTMTCSNGTMSYGGTVSNTCAVAACAACTNPSGGTTAHNGTRTEYQTTSVACGSTCSSQTRTCNNGSWTPSAFTYANASCSVATCNCTAPWGSTVNNGSSVTAYNLPTGACTSMSCSSVATQTRTCTNTVLSGSYGCASCALPANTTKICGFPLGTTLPMTRCGSFPAGASPSGQCDSPETLLGMILDRMSTGVAYTLAGTNNTVNYYNVNWNSAVMTGTSLPVTSYSASISFGLFSWNGSAWVADYRGPWGSGGGNQYGLWYNWNGTPANSIQWGNNLTRFNMSGGVPASKYSYPINNGVVGGVNYRIAWRETTPGPNCASSAAILSTQFTAGQ